MSTAEIRSRRKLWAEALRSGAFDAIADYIEAAA